MNHLVMLGNEDSDGGKALQVYLGEMPYLVLGPDDWKHHKMLGLFLDENGIKYSIVNLNGPNFGPPATGENYRLAGAGWFSHFYRDIIELSGHSDSYRICPDEQHAKEISDLCGIKIEIKIF